MKLTRRQILSAGLAGALAGGLALRPTPGLADPLRPRAAAADLPDPSSSGIDHIVVLTMENRSFDHIMGWLPGANGMQAGLSYPDASGALHPTYHLATYQGCGHPDPDHSYAGARAEYDNGACDGWLQVNDAFSIGYYQQSDLPFLGNAGPAFTVCDNYYASTLGPTFPNRLYAHAAQTDRIDDSISFTSLPTIWDSLAAAGVSHAYYYNDLPFLSLWGLQYLGISHGFGHFQAAAATGSLPAVCYVDPPLFLEAVDGLSTDDHPHGDIRNGEAFMNTVYQAVSTGPAWDRTVLVITFDEWGGFFDHVAPTAAPDTNPSLTGLRGFRVPALVISPLAPRGTVAHGLYDHTSILKMIAWRHGLPALTPRDAAANNLADVLNFSSQPDTSAPQWTVDPVFDWPCLLTGTQALGNGTTAPVATTVKRQARSTDAPPWAQLAHQAKRLGWHTAG